MGNVLMGEEAYTVASYGQLSRFGLGIMEHSIRGVQQARSQSLQDIKKKLTVLPSQDEETRNIMERVLE